MSTKNANPSLARHDIPWPQKLFLNICIVDKYKSKFTIVQQECHGYGDMLQMNAL
jgi:hypothetical protein